jgi:hypothetical protein
VRAVVQLPYVRLPTPVTYRVLTFTTCSCVLQGTVFLNRRYFVLDRLSRRLYVYTNDIASHPRYHLDFAETRCSVTAGVDSSGADDEPVSMELVAKHTSSSDSDGARGISRCV